MSIFDLYRVVLLAEIAIIGGLYVWSLSKYLQRARGAEDEWLRRFRYGQAARVAGVLIILALFALAIIDALGRPDIGRTLYNLLLQVALALFAVAWGFIDLTRFRTIMGRPSAAIEHIDALDRESTRRRQARKAR